jgi:MOSC domain-containing protein YiiM
VRVLVPGTVAASDPIALVRRGDAAGTVARVAAVRAAEGDVAGAAALAALPGLSAKWRERFARRAGTRT